MKEKRPIYVAIDLKSYYASVECVDRKLDPLTTNLVVADTSKTEKTICLAVTPALKAYGIGGRARLFEVIQRVKEINIERQKRAPGGVLCGESHDANELLANPSLALSFLAAPPRMSYYLEYSAKIYEIYLKYAAPQDIHVYSIDEVFIDATSYIAAGDSPKAYAKTILSDIFSATGITATAGIGTNLYLCKIAMDIVAKHCKPDQDGARIALLDEQRYRKLLWTHTPLTDFWRVGKGYAKKLNEVGLYTMGDIARCSIGDEDAYYNEELLYRLFGVNAELLIDHAWGYESCTMKDIKAYQPENQSIGAGQVLSTPYDFDKARLVVKEMMDLLALDLVDKRFVCDQVILTIGYDIENVQGNAVKDMEITTDRYGRKVPKHAHGAAKLPRYTSSSKLMIAAAMSVFDRVVNPHFTVRRITIAANHVIEEARVDTSQAMKQMDFFTDYEKLQREKEQEDQELAKEKRLQEATLQIKKRFGKNAVLKGMNLEEGANTRERNGLLGGHKA